MGPIKIWIMTYWIIGSKHVDVWESAGTLTPILECIQKTTEKTTEDTRPKKDREAACGKFIF